MPDLTLEQKLRNVANAVLVATEVKRQYNGRGKCATYAGDIDRIALASRHLAELVLEMLGREMPSAEKKQ